MFGSDFSGEYRLTRQVYTCLRLLPAIFAAVYGYGKSSLSKPLNRRISVFTSAVTACCDVIFVCIPAPDHILFRDQRTNGECGGGEGTSMLPANQAGAATSVRNEELDAAPPHARHQIELFIPFSVILNVTRCLSLSLPIPSHSWTLPLS